MTSHLKLLFFCLEVILTLTSNMGIRIVSHLGKNINIDYLMVGLRYGFYPRVTDVISRTSEVRASE